MKIDVSGYHKGVMTLLESRGETVSSYVKNLRQVAEVGDYTMPEASINVPFEEALLEAVLAFTAKFKTEELRYVFLIGIGGSNLGSEAIYRALTAYEVEDRELVRLVGIDTNNPAIIAKALNIIGHLNQKSEFAVVSISKSGGTTETIANTEIILEALEKKFGPVPERVVVISDTGSPFLNEARALGMHTFAMPPKVGGRYSVFTAVGLLPLALCGIDVVGLVAGAKEAIRPGTHLDVKLNPATSLALLMVDAHNNGKPIHDMFVFNSELETFGKWWRQLVGESLAKRTNSTNKLVGITPTVSVGSTDLHSVGQLYLGGPADKLTFFLYARPPHDFAVPSSRVFPTLVPMVASKSLSQIMEAIKKGTMQAFLNRERSYIEIELSELSTYELGFLMQTLMLSVIYSGHLLDVNSFDQPDVEAYKITTKELLEKKTK